MALQSENVINCMRTDGYFITNATNSSPCPVNTRPATNNTMQASLADINRQQFHTNHMDFCIINVKINEH